MTRIQPPQQSKRQTAGIRGRNNGIGGWALVLMALAIGSMVGLASADDYSVAEGNQSLLVAVGCFWCGEQAFEQYAPGVIEVVSGYAGGENENPTYRNHPGHYEVILIEYDPTKTSYEVLVNYAYRNMDPFDSLGQFCDKGTSYLPAIFYATETEKEVAEDVLASILEQQGWDLSDIAAPILERPVFWKAEEYHQDYYIKNPGNYGYYKNACRRPQRLKEVWGEEEYQCYHEEEHTCFIEMLDGSNTTLANAGITVPGKVLNEAGELVDAESNIKNADAERANPVSFRGIIGLSFGAVFLVAAVLCYDYKTGKLGGFTRRFRPKEEEQEQQQEQPQSA